MSVLTKRGINGIMHQSIPTVPSALSLYISLYRERAMEVMELRERERVMELKLTGIALNRPKNLIGGKKYTREVRWVIFI